MDRTGMWGLGEEGRKGGKGIGAGWRGVLTAEGDEAG